MDPLTSNWRVGIPLLLLVLIPAGLYPQASSDSLLTAQRALYLQEAGDYGAAADAYRAYLKAHPDDADALSNLGVVLVRLGQYDEALEEYKAAERLRPGDWRIKLNLALADLKSGRLHEAAAQLEQAHSQSPQVKQISLLLADSLLQLGENDHVITLLQPLERDDPSDKATAYMLGTALIRERRIEEGEILLDRILRDGDSAEARFLLGTQYYESGNYPAAVKELGSAIELNASLPGLESYYGMALLQTGDPDAAAIAFRQELARNPNDFNSNLAMGQILNVARKFTEAIPLLERAVVLRPQSTEAMLAFGESLTGVGKLQEARGRLEAAIQAAPDSLEAHQDLAAVYSRLRLPTEAAREQNVVNRLQHRAGAGSSALGVNDPAPAFELQEVGFKKEVRLSQFRGKNPIVLVFGSYTCPNFRDSAAALNSLNTKYGSRIPFYLVYIREAHATSNWESTENEREGISLPPAATMAEKLGHAAICTRRLHLNFPALVDGIDCRVEKAYAAWPSHVFVIGENGRILYTSGLSRQDFQPKAMEAAVRSAFAAEKSGPRRMATFP
ncbi:MAG: tetratricopeptide repeat protein [Acidobacteria bacterium]|nr:MAG: tetratricopeptide repeat protein [Acidobacteriota bacterium]